MAEPSIIYSRLLVEIFLKEYNKQNKTSYKWLDDKSYQPKDKPYFDFIVYDGKNELGLQHINAVVDPEREFKLPKASRKVVDPLRKSLENNPNIPSLSVHLNFHNPPFKDDETSGAIFWLEYLITHKISTSLGLGYFNYDAGFDEQVLPNVRKYINDIEILPYRGKTKGKCISISYSWGKEKPESWPNDAFRIIQAVEKKEKECRDIILLIESGWSSVNEAYIPEIVERLKPKKMKEVWIIETFLGREKAVRVK
jgi:hypothetical protein